MSTKKKLLLQAIKDHLHTTDVKVWYEPIHGPCFEMMGYAGGWYMEGEDVGLTPLGYNIKEVLDTVKLLGRTGE